MQQMEGAAEAVQIPLALQRGAAMVALLGPIPPALMVEVVAEVVETPQGAMGRPDSSHSTGGSKS